MSVTLSPNIAEYAEKKGRAGLEIGLRTSGCCCCGPSIRLNTRFISQERLEKLRKKDYSEYEAEGLKIMVENRIPMNGDIHIEMFRSLGMNVFQVNGITHTGLSCKRCG